MHPTKGHALINAVEIFEVITAESKTLPDEGNLSTFFMLMQIYQLGLCQFGIKFSHYKEEDLKLMSICFFVCFFTFAVCLLEFLVLSICMLFCFHFCDLKGLHEGNID